MPSKKQIDKVINDIQKRASNKYPDIVKTVPASPEILMVFDEAINNEELPLWKRKYYKAMRKEFDKEKKIIDKDVAEKRDKFIQNEINEAISKGLLPKQKDNKIKVK